MRGAWVFLLLSGMALGQAAETQKPDAAAGSAPAAAEIGRAHV